MFTPAQLGQHRLFFTCAWTFVIFSVFWYTIGEFPYYEMVQFPDPQRSTCLEAIFRTPMGYGSSQLVHWINNVRPTALILSRSMQGALYQLPYPRLQLESPLF